MLEWDLNPWPLLYQRSAPPISWAIMSTGSWSLCEYVIDHENTISENMKDDIIVGKILWRHDWSSLFITTQLNPLTPVPPVTARDKPRPFFHFWRHHFWQKLASSILNFCGRKRSFQWCLVHSDRLIGTWNMHKNAQKVEKKTQSQISCHYTYM